MLLRDEGRGSSMGSDSRQPPCPGCLVRIFPVGGRVALRWPEKKLFSTQWQVVTLAMMFLSE